ncbi:hypothetical protein [Streptomyces sp. NBC_01803]|uniref:hypothetical protein n=1 Tax=Streptomyces sp. NBC_01803 TaxID=2975946 RepID=UPI002DDB1203|nr:hypothetical protein [Streptomyces sp. NBC_01803]WSA46378.1 hypothetical protein OIE51_20625 [Streptomyces sp. NBC_01803]
MAPSSTVISNRTLAWFPLVARPRPACTPLHQRVADLCDRARAADQNSDTGEASAVFNLSALLASDVGLPDLARHWCHRHANVYLRAHPLDAKATRRALEPLVNLVRLHIRDGDGERAFTLIESLFTAVNTRTGTTIDGITIPAATLTTSSEAHQDVRKWLWAVLLSTGSRALAVAGRWDDAHTQLRRYKGIGRRILDGRQVAVLAHATAGDHSGALALLEDTTPGEPWENAVTTCLTALCRHHAQQPTDHDLAALLDRYQHLDRAPAWPSSTPASPCPPSTPPATSTTQRRATSPPTSSTTPPQPATATPPATSSLTTPAPAFSPPTKRTTSPRSSTCARSDPATSPHPCGPSCQPRWTPANRCSPARSRTILSTATRYRERRVEDFAQPVDQHKPGRWLAYYANRQRHTPLEETDRDGHRRRAEVARADRPVH